MSMSRQRKRAQIAELLLACCEAVYLHEDGPGFTSFCSNRGLQSHVITNKNARAAVFSNDDCIIGCMAGTNDVSDWKNNLSFKMRSYVGAGMVSSGFGAYFGLIRKQLINALQGEFSKNPRPIYICGHSLGGVCTYYLALACQNAGVLVDLAVVAGAPRPGDKTFSEYFSERFGGRFIQIRNKADIVPCVPPYIAGYRHPLVGLAVINLAGNISRKMHPVLQQAQRIFRIVSGHVSLSGIRIGKAISIADHSISEYRSAVGKSLDSLKSKATDWAG